MQVEALTAPNVDIFSNSWGARDDIFDGPMGIVNEAMSRGVTQVYVLYFRFQNHY